MNRLIKCLLVTYFYLFMMLCSSISFAARYQSKSGTVLDTVTKLIWQEKSPNESYTWSEAEAYCKQQNAEKLGGYSSDWRLPEITELLTIVDYRRVNPAFDQDAFSGPTKEYWTSTPHYGDSVSAWLVDFKGGGNSYWGSKTLSNYVRCVR
jgi:hypothetical protein